jgi:glycosyltransferase involved in cell wall biosynthesis
MKVIIFEPHEDISTNPTLVNLVERLCEDGIPVDIYQPGHDDYYPPLRIKSNIVTIYKYETYPTFVRGEGFLNSLYDLKRKIGKIRMHRIYPFIKRELTKKAIILAVNPGGVIEAYKYYKHLHVPFVYLSFEIFFMDEMQFKWQRALKQREIEASQKAFFIVIQDSQRADLLKTENKLSYQDLFYLPVAPSISPPVKKTEYLRKKFMIPDGKIIVIHAGTITTWSCAEELLENTRYWHEDFTLVMHSRNRPNEYIRQLMERYKTSNIIFSTEPCGTLEYNELLASADIGLTLYKPVYDSPFSGRNIETIGLSSGKFSSCMKCGIPTVSLKQPYFRELLAEYRFGFDIDDFQQLPEALLNIRKDHALYSREAKRLFKDKLNFDIYYPALREKLMSFL